MRPGQALLLALKLGEVTPAVHLHSPWGRTVGSVVSLLQLNLYSDSPPQSFKSGNIRQNLAGLFADALKHIVAFCCAVTIAGGREEK